MFFFQSASFDKMHVDSKALGGLFLEEMIIQKIKRKAFFVVFWFPIKIMMRTGH